ncbi:MAG: hypothetical protein QW390_02685, partial [Candidatus Bathyarchaeia archaeon]
TINLTGWSIKTKVYKKTILFPPNTMIKPNAYYVYDIPGMPFSEKKEQIKLLNPASQEVDSTPLVDEKSALETWQRYPNGVDTGSDSDWKLRPRTKWLSNGGESITISLSKTSIKLGEKVTVTGSVDPGHRSYVKIVEAAEGAIATLETGNDGSYAFDWTPPAIKTYTLKAVAVMDSGVESGTASLTVTKLPSEVVVLPPNSAAVDRYSSILGFINPVHDSTPVTLTLGLPNGTILTYNLQTTSDGFFNHTFKVQTAGVWNVSASWAGDSTYDGAQSSLKYFYAEGLPPGFSPALALLIAPTAAAVAAALGLGLRRGKARAPTTPQEPMRFFEKQIAKPKPPKPPKPAVQVPRCTKDGTPLAFIEQYGRYQCPLCKRMY